MVSLFVITLNHITATARIESIPMNVVVIIDNITFMLQDLNDIDFIGTISTSPKIASVLASALHRGSSFGIRVTPWVLITRPNDATFVKNILNAFVGDVCSAG